MDEEPLYGGLVDRVVRVGDTVRRPAGPWTPTVQAVLRHLRDRGFPAPEPLGLDEVGREIVSYLPGEVCLRPWPAKLRVTQGVEDVGRLIRALHDALSDFVPPEPALWQLGGRRLLAGEIVRHTDLGPYNIIWSGDSPVGIIDWDLAYPGTALHDLEIAAWQIVPLASDEAALSAGLERAEPLERLRALVDGYGDVGVLDLLVGVLQVQDEDLHRTAVMADLGREPWTTFRERGLPDETAKDKAWLEANIGRLATA